MKNIARIDAKIIENNFRLDANEKAFFTRQLEYIKSRTYDILYPNFKAQQHIPVSTEAGPGAETITYRQFDSVGFSKVIANYADDLPRVDTLGKEFTSKVRPHGNSYGYNIDEIANAAFANQNLNARKANASRRAYEQFVNDVGWFAKTDVAKYHGMSGFLYAPNITTATAHTGATSGSVVWSGKTADEIQKDIDDAITAIIDNTKGVHVPNTILLPIAQYRRLQTIRIPNTGMSLMKYIMENHPEITEIDWVNELKDVSPLPSAPTGSGTGDIMIVYEKSPDNLTLEIPKPYTQLPVQERNLEFVVNTHARIGGVIVYYPLAIHFTEGI